MTIVEQLAKDKVVEGIARNLKIPPDEINDLAQECYLILLEYDQNKLNRINKKNEIQYFITKIIMNQYFSKTSTYHYKYRKFYELINSKYTDGYEWDGTESDNE